MSTNRLIINDIESSDNTIETRSLLADDLYSAKVSDSESVKSPIVSPGPMSPSDNIELKSPTFSQESTSPAYNKELMSPVFNSGIMSPTYSEGSKSPTSPGTEYNCYETLRSPTSSQKESENKIYNTPYGSYAPIRSISISAPSLSALTEDKKSVYSLNCLGSSETHPNVKKHLLTIAIPNSQIFFTHKIPDDLNYYLKSYIFTSEPYGVYLVNKKGQIISLKINNITYFKSVIDSILIEYPMVTDDFVQWAQPFTGLALNQLQLVTQYLTIDKLTPLNNQLPSEVFSTFDSLIPSSISNLSPQLGIDTDSSFINRPYCSSGTGIFELGPYYELITEKGLTAINIHYMRIKKLLEPDQQPQTFFMAYNKWSDKWYGDEKITREKLDLFITYFRTDIPEWNQFVAFYHRSNMVFLKREQYDSCQLQFNQGLATLSEKNIEKLFDEKEPTIDGRRLADSTNKTGNLEIHGDNTVIYAFVEDRGVLKLLIAKDTLGQFHHTSFAAANEKEGVGVITAGTMKIKNGKITELTNQSGHYKPSQKRFNRLLKYLIANNATADLELIKITVKTINYVKNKDGKLEMKPGTRDIIIKGKEKIQKYLNEVNRLSEKTREKLNNSNSFLSQIRSRRNSLSLSGSSQSINSSSFNTDSLVRSSSAAVLRSSSAALIESTSAPQLSSSLLSSALEASLLDSDNSHHSELRNDKIFRKGSMDEDVPSLIRTGSGEFILSPSFSTTSQPDLCDASPSPMEESFLSSTSKEKGKWWSSSEIKHNNNSPTSIHSSDKKSVFSPSYSVKTPLTRKASSRSSTSSHSSSKVPLQLRQAQLNVEIDMIPPKKPKKSILEQFTLWIKKQQQKKEKVFDNSSKTHSLF